MDADELGALLRTRRKAADRTIASVAVAAGLSVPYIANLENGRGNPTMAALQRLSEALGARLHVALVEDQSPQAPTDDDSVRQLLDGSPRVPRIVDQLVAAQPADRRAVTDRIGQALRAVGTVLPDELTERDLDRLLDLLLLAVSGEDKGTG